MKASFSKVDITPKLPVHLAGFGVERIAHEIYDSLYARILYFKGDQEVLWVQFDLVGIDSGLVEKIKKQTGIENCILSATHTHSGPCGVLNLNEGPLKGLESVFGEYQEDYVEWIASIISSKVQEIKETCEDCQVRIMKGKVHGLGSDRHDESLEGDEDALLLEFKTQSQQVLLVRLACHPTILNASSLGISADFCGEIEKDFPEYEMVAYVNGSCGDISTRFTRQQNGLQEVRRMGQLVTQQLRELLNQSCEFCDFEMKYMHQFFEIKTRKVDSLEVAQAKVEKAKENLAQAIKEKKSAKEIRVMESYVEGAQNNLLGSQSLGSLSSLSLPISALMINEQVIIFTPVELFCKLSNPMKKEMNAEFVGYTNGYFLYMPDEMAYEKQYYESFSSPFEKKEAEKLMQEIKCWVIRNC